MTREIGLAFAHPSERAAATAGPELRDRISLRDHVREVEIGAFQSERGHHQRVCFNVVVELRQLASDLADDVDRVLSYDTITDAIDHALAAERLNLLETLAERVADNILVDARAARVFVRIEKLDRGPGALGVEIMRDTDKSARIVPDQTERLPSVLYLETDAVHSPDLPAMLDRLEADGLPVILCVGAPGDAVRADHPAAQRRIDLLEIEQMAWVLAGRDPRCVVVASRTELDWAIRHGQISVWAPSKLVLDAGQDDPPRADADARELAGWLAALFMSRNFFCILDKSDGKSEGVTICDVTRGHMSPR